MAQLRSTDDRTYGAALRSRGVGVNGGGTGGALRLQPLQGAQGDTAHEETNKT